MKIALRNHYTLSGMADSYNNSNNNLSVVSAGEDAGRQSSILLMWKGAPTLTQNNSVRTP